MGRVGVIGGSKDYTGAPFYAAESALKFGADLSYVFCSKLASIPIKCYSPELMVTSFYDDDIFDQNTTETSHHLIKHSAEVLSNSFSRLHSVVIGPGLGRNTYIGMVLSIAINQAIQNDIPMVIDADGLWFVSNNLSLIMGYKKCILTPNKVEFDRLVFSAIAFLKANTTNITNEGYLLTDLTDNSNEALLKQIRAVSLILGGVTILCKGRHDIISNGEDVYIWGNDFEGSKKRCGGQGDILAGCLSVALHWANKRKLEMVSSTDWKAAIQIKDENNSQQSHFINVDSQYIPSNDPKKIIISNIQGSHDVIQETIEERSPDYTALNACLLSSIVVKRASFFGFEKKGRSMTAPDVIQEINKAFIEQSPYGI